MINGVLTHVGISIKKSELDYDTRVLISKKLTIKQRMFTGWIKKTKGYTNQGKYYIIPRFGHISHKFPNLNVVNKLNRGRQIDISHYTVTPTRNQTVVKNYILNNYYTTEKRKSGCAGVIVNMQPGQGKTYLAMDMINHLKCKVAIIVPTTYLLKQWYDACSLAFPSNTIGVYYGTRKTMGDIVIMVINSALSSEMTYNNHKTESSTKWWSRFRFIIYDEIHMYCSENRADIFSSAQAQYVLGLSATPQSRSDKLDQIAMWNIGPILDANDIDTFQNDDVVYNTEVKVIKYRCVNEYAETIISDAGTVCVPKMINNFVMDPQRNEIIINEAMRLYQLGLCIFIFTDRRTHVSWIVDELRKYQYSADKDEFARMVPLTGNVLSNVYDFLYPEPLNVTMLLGGSDDDEIYAAKTHSRIIVTTYAYSSTGISIDKLNAAILATPRKSNMTQILGRIYRLSGDPRITRRIVDIVDWNTPLKKQYYTRKKVYIDKNSTFME